MQKWKLIFRCMLQGCFLSVLLLLPFGVARAEEQHSNYRLETGFLNSFLVSQEYMKHSFADYDSDVRPLPAYVFVVHTETQVIQNYNLIVDVSIPVREEVVKYRGRDSWSYYYPKTVLIAFDGLLGAVSVAEGSNLEFRLGFGLSSPLSHRFGRDLFPSLAPRLRLAVSDSAGIHVGFGYIGNVSRGLWFIPFGFGYRI
jgi:hypothetical protein